MTIGKRMKAQAAKVAQGKHYPLDDALTLLKGTASAKFDESVDVAINLGIDAKKSDQRVHPRYRTPWQRHGPDRHPHRA